LRQAVSFPRVGESSVKQQVVGVLIAGMTSTLALHGTFGTDSLVIGTWGE